MFGNKGYVWKLLGALALVAGMGVFAARRGESINPPLWRCVAQPARWEGTVLWIPYARIVSVAESDFVIDATEARIRVSGRAPGGINAFVSLRGVFRADGPRLEMLRSRVLPPDGALRRRIMEAVSILVVLAVLANLARHFLFRPKALQFERGQDG